MITIFNQNLRVVAMILNRRSCFQIKIFEFLLLISVLNVMKYSNHSKVYDGIKTGSQSHFFTYESINMFDNVEFLCLQSDLVLFSISKLQYRNSISYFNLLLLFSGDISLNPGPLHNDQLQRHSEWSVFNLRGLHFIHLNILAKNCSTLFFYCNIYLHFLRPCCENIFNIVCIVSKKSEKNIWQFDILFLASSSSCL